MSAGGGLVLGRRSLEGYTPPHDVPGVACYGCPGVSQAACCQLREFARGPRLQA